MPILTPHGLRPSLSEHPAFLLMLAETLDRFHCTLCEVREVYWMNRMWRSLASDRGLDGRVARLGVSVLMLTGAGYGAAPPSRGERERWAERARRRILAGTGRTLDALVVSVRWAEGALTVATVPVQSLLAQVVSGDPKWGDLIPWAEDLCPVMVPVVCHAEAEAAA